MVSATKCQQQWRRQTDKTIYHPIDTLLGFPVRRHRRYSATYATALATKDLPAGTLPSSPIEQHVIGISLP